MNKQPKLLPCPFCGYQFSKKEVNQHYDCAFVECSQCDAQGPFVFSSDDKPIDAINAWNNRARPKIDDKSKV